jgi:hypothetical protein
MLIRLCCAALAVVTLASLDGAGLRAAVSSRALVFARDGDLYAIALNGSRLVRLTKTPVWDESSGSSPRTSSMKRSAPRAG